MWVVIVASVIGPFISAKVFTNENECSEQDARNAAAQFADPTQDHIIILPRNEFDPAGLQTLVEDHLANCGTVSSDEMEIPDLGIKMPVPGTDFSFN